jgi:Na+-transporting NADH:ubiquinone oxidoreductase subunit NqrB
MIFFMFWVAMGSRPIRSRTVNMGRVLERSLVSVVKGPALPFFLGGKTIGTLGTICFWTALIGTACWSRDKRIRRVFYVLFGMLIVMTLFGMVGQIAMGLVAMSHALG